MARYQDLSDDELIILLKQSDEQALSALYFRYWDKLLLAAANRLETPEEAEEVVQDIFVSLWNRRHQLILRHRLSTYLAVAVKYPVIDVMDKRYRLRNRQQENEHLEIAYLSPSADAYLLEKELISRIEASISGLPEKCRIVFKLSRQEGKSNKQIAAEMNITESTVEKHLTKALKDIRSDLAVALPAFMLLLAEQSIH